MAPQFYELKVKKITRETDEAISITFIVPDDLKEIFEYKHGQYLTIKAPVGNKDNRRAYSISSSPAADEDITVTVKRVDEGTVSRYLNDELKEGMFLEVMPPFGRFTIELDPSLKREFVLIGGGSGITPLMSILKTVLDKEPGSTISLIYANRNLEAVIFRSQLAGLQEKYPGRLKVINVLSRPENGWEGRSGRLNAQRIKELINEYCVRDSSTEYFLCGPPGMMVEAENALIALNVDFSRVHKESFTAPLPDELDEKAAGSEDLEIKQQKVRIILYGEEHEVVVEPDETILTAAMREGFDPPFSCQIGACSTCRAMLKSGKVHMDEREALTDNEMKEGYILSCQAHPLTSDCVVDYDE